MTGKTHLLTGVCAGVLTAASIASDNAIMFGLTITATCMGSIIPDIDNEKSMVGSNIKILSKLINKISGHRGFTHAPLLLAVFFIAMYYVMKHYQFEYYMPVLYGYTIGYTSHLLLDMLTKNGIPLLYPFLKKRTHIFNIKSGGIAEFLILCGLLVIIIASLFLFLCIKNNDLP